MSNYNRNPWCTTNLTLNVMSRVANTLKLDIHDDNVSERLYWICCDLEDWPEGEGFGSSDSSGYVRAAEKEFDLSASA